ncbi:MAG: diguanylate cyclase [Anaerovibrio sp.]|nr:diguanylate cyclase [Anaerovibrio sp.]
MPGRVFTVEKNCIACNKCITVCPVDMANQVYRSLDQKRKISVNSKYCISCGACLNVCDHGARDYTDDTERFFLDLTMGETIHLVVAPAAQVNFSNLPRLFGRLKSLGVGNIYDVSLGADISTWAYLKARQEWSLSTVIAQPCPVIVNYCERYEPELLPFLAPVQSPLICLAIYLRLEEKLKGKIAFLSPCIAKADEIEDPNTGRLVSYNVTFDKLKQKLAEMGVDLSQYPKTGFDGRPPGIGHVYSRPGGLSETVQVTDKNIWMRQVDSVDNAYSYLQEYHNRIEAHLPVPELVDILNCKGGCNFGTGTNRQTSMDEVDYKTNTQKQKKLDELVMETADGPVYGIEEYFDNVLDWKDYRRLYTNRKIENGTFTDEDLDDIFYNLRKNTVEARKINCHACGYGSCKRFAQAIKIGINMPESCIEYERSRLLHDTLTPLLNHAGLEAALEQSLWLYQTRQHDDLAVLMLDVDDFKMVNDSFGHDVGDEVLKAVAKAISRNIGEKASAGRWGGDEFMVILPNTCQEEAEEIAETIKQAVKDSDVLPHGEHFTSSVGVACARDDDTPLAVFQRVDRSLYEAKKHKIPRSRGR